MVDIWTEEYNQTMKRALGDEITWNTVTSTREDMDKADVWLTACRKRVDADIARKRMELDEGANRGEFERWRVKAHSFQSLVDIRRRQLAGMIRTDNVRENELRQTSATSALRALGQLVEEHEDGKISDRELYTGLDTIHMSDGKGGKKSIQQLLEETRHDKS
jgi:hypothetical protein